YFFFNLSATTEIYTLSLHDALPILLIGNGQRGGTGYHHQRTVGFLDRLQVMQAHRTAMLDLDIVYCRRPARGTTDVEGTHGQLRSEEHTSELQSRENLVCRLLLEKK